MVTIKKPTWLLVLFLACSIILASCGGGDDDDVTPPDEPQPVEPVDPDPPVPVQPTFNNMKEALEHIKEVEKITKVESSKYKESYNFYFRQPIDHQNPDGGTFLQQVAVNFKGFDAITVINTCGYAMDGNDDDLAELIEGNLVVVEHRYFGKSVVGNDPEWKYLTTKQEADDLHAIVTALKTALRGKWIATGVSKNGNTAIEFRFFHPEDVDGTVPFCSPILTSLNDVRPISYMLKECGTPEVNATMNKIVEKLLKGAEQGFYKTFCEYQIESEEKVATFTQYCYAVLNIYFSQFMNVSRSSWAKYFPDLDTPDKKLCEIIDEMVPLTFEKDEEEDLSLYPYCIQQVKELGIESCLTDETLVWLKGSSCTEESIITMRLRPQDKWLMKTYDNTVQTKIANEFLPTTTCKILLVYSKDDPWTGGRPKEFNNPNVKVLINPVGIHDECLKSKEETYDEATAKAIKAFVDGL